MGRAVAVRADYTAGEVRRLAKRAKDAAQARRLLAIAAVLDGASRADAAKIGGMDRQTLRDWVIRFNDQGPDGLINIPSPGVPPKLDATHRAFLARIVEEGPIPAVHGVARWRACDLNHAAARGVRALGVGRHHVHRATRLGRRQSLIVRIGISLRRPPSVRSEVLQPTSSCMAFFGPGQYRGKYSSDWVR